MGTPISTIEIDPFDYVRYGCAPQHQFVPAEVLTPEQWLVLVNEELETIKPYLKYLPGFKTLRELITTDLPSHGIGDVYPVNFGHGVSFQTLCRVAFNRRFWSSPGDWSHVLVLLDRDGYFLDWTSTTTHWGDKKLEQNVTVRRLDDQSLLTLLHEDATHLSPPRLRLGPAFLEKLKPIVAEAIADRERRLDDMRYLKSRLGGPLKRIRTN